MTKKEPDFAYGKKLGMVEVHYGDIPFMLDMIGRLLYCMKESNKINGQECEFFRIDFRDHNFLDNLPSGMLCVEMKWGRRDKLKKDEETKNDTH